jgi:ubiquitin carboxyl-terminal hydrolase 6/32
MSRKSNGSSSSLTSSNGAAVACSAAVPSRPGLIDTSSLVQSPAYRGITVLTGEGGRLRNGGRLLRGKDYELLPERLWKFVAQMYGGSSPLPRQVIR